MKRAAVTVVGLLAFVCTLAACSAKAPEAQKAALSAGVVARVDGEPIHSETVAAIAQAQGISADEALKKATFDALVAREAKAQGVESRTHTEVSAELARLLIDDLTREARAKGEPTEDELGPFVESRWWELARPDGVVVAHVVVQVPEGADATTDDAALAIARKLRTAVATLQAEARKTPQPDFGAPGKALKKDPIALRFEEVALAVDHPGFELQADMLPPFGADGYAQQRDLLMFEQAFVKGALALAERGDLSEPVRGKGGWHVIMLLGKTPGHQATRAELIAEFGEAIVLERARNALAGIVARGRKEQDASIARNTDELTLQVKVGR